MPEGKKDGPKGPVRHKVLYMTAGGVERPLLSREVNDPHADDDISAYKLDEINRARHAGAARPTFRVALECEGREVQ
jgi:hypothetical protein